MNTQETKITVIELKGKFQLACQYPNQYNPQPCYIELDLRNETLTADYNGEIGNAVPFSVWHGHEQRYPIPCMVAVAANALLAEIAPLAERVLAGYECVWDGNNHVANFTDDAQEADNEISAICEREMENIDEANAISFVAPSDWFYAIKDETQGKTDAELETMSADWKIEAEGENIYLTGDVLDVLKSWRDEYAEEEQES